ncbi:MAG: ribosome rescue GTPase HflX [Pseudomonadota bacterium]
MFERHEGGERAVLVNLEIDGYPDADSHNGTSNQSEFEELAVSAGASIESLVRGSRHKPDPKYFVGKGKAQEIHDAVVGCGADLVIFNHALSPAQERNLERLVSCRVIDRTGLILAIFAQRARSFEGKLQVELAQLQHLSTRLVRGWTHLERQKGGIGLRGPGETQLETDRRLLAVRVKQIKRRLAQVHKQRQQNRVFRRKSETPTAVLVGYTNAGKSTLFNRLCGQEAYAADQLFATLDTTLRKLELPNGQAVVLADTVGFVSDLPHELVSAFHATLQEACEADLLLHVIDNSSDERHSQIHAVNDVLHQIGANEVPTLLVANKTDRIAGDVGLERDESDHIVQARVSALKGDGIEELLHALQELLKGDRAIGYLRVGPEMGALRAQLYADKAVCSEQSESNGSMILEVNIERYRWHQLCKQYDLEQNALADTELKLARLA